MGTLENYIGERDIFERAYNKIEENGLSSVLFHPKLIRDRRIIRDRMIKYYESTEEYEKCNFLKDFFDQVEKEITLGDMINSLGKDAKQKDRDK